MTSLVLQFFTSRRDVDCEETHPENPVIILLFVLQFQANCWLCAGNKFLCLYATHTQPELFSPIGNVKLRENASLRKGPVTLPTCSAVLSRVGTRVVNAFNSILDRAASLLSIRSVSQQRRRGMRMSHLPLCAHPFPFSTRLFACVACWPYFMMLSTFRFVQAGSLWRKNCGGNWRKFVWVNEIDNTAGDLWNSELFVRVCVVFIIIAGHGSSAVPNDIETRAVVFCSGFIITFCFPFSQFFLRLFSVLQARRRSLASRAIKKEKKEEEPASDEKEHFNKNLFTFERRQTSGFLRLLAEANNNPQKYIKTTSILLIACWPFLLWNYRRIDFERWIGIVPDRLCEGEHMIMLSCLPIHIDGP